MPDEIITSKKGTLTSEGLIPHKKHRFGFFMPVALIFPKMKDRVKGIMDRPLKPLKQNGKDPLLGGGVNDASKDPAKVQAWWAKNPSANIGIALRASGLGVVD
ncbi:MAG: bifunctional DNA primase/polymerase, partial [Chlamydiales bacterium]|nr:bifunctional DNA primase/polymerase [Chlamydiales bacterium]